MLHVTTFLTLQIPSQVMLLTDGRLAFTGTPTKTIEFFKSIGFEAPAGKNPACYLMSSLSEDGKRSTKWISDRYAVTQAAIDRDHQIAVAMKRGHEKGGELWHYLEEKLTPRRSFKTFWLIIFLLTYRNLLNVKRNPSIQIVRIIQKVVRCLLWDKVSALLSKIIASLNIYLLPGDCCALWPVLLWVFEFGPDWNPSCARSDLYHDLREHLPRHVRRTYRVSKRISHLHQGAKVRTLQRRPVLRGQCPWHVARGNRRADSIRLHLLLSRRIPNDCLWLPGHLSGHYSCD